MPFDISHFPVASYFSNEAECLHDYKHNKMEYNVGPDSFDLDSGKLIFGIRIFAAFQFNINIQAEIDSISFVLIFSYFI